MPFSLSPYATADGRPGSYIFLVDVGGDLHVAKEFDEKSFSAISQHSDLARGAPARICGEIHPFSDGTWRLNDSSGRYCRRFALPNEPCDSRGYTSCRTQDQLEKVCEILKGCGCSCKTEKEIFQAQFEVKKTSFLKESASNFNRTKSRKDTDSYLDEILKKSDFPEYDFEMLYSDAIERYLIVAEDAERCLAWRKRNLKPNWFGCFTKNQ